MPSPPLTDIEERWLSQIAGAIAEAESETESSEYQAKHRQLSQTLAAVRRADKDNLVTRDLAVAEKLLAAGNFADTRRKLRDALKVVKENRG